MKTWIKALLSFAILITMFSEPFFTDGSPQQLDINEQLSATHPIEETDRKPWISSSDYL